MMFNLAKDWEQIKKFQNWLKNILISKVLNVFDNSLKTFHIENHKQIRTSEAQQFTGSYKVNYENFHDKAISISVPK